MAASATEAIQSRRISTLLDGRIDLEARRRGVEVLCPRRQPPIVSREHPETTEDIPNAVMYWFWAFWLSISILGVILGVLEAVIHGWKHNGQIDRAAKREADWYDNEFMRPAYLQSLAPQRTLTVNRFNAVMRWTRMPWRMAEEDD